MTGAICLQPSSWSMFGVWKCSPGLALAGWALGCQCLQPWGALPWPQARPSAGGHLPWCPFWL